MANAFLNETEYANTMLLMIKNRLVMAKLVDGRFEDKVSDENGLKIYVKRPPRFVAKDGATLALQNIVAGSTSLSVNRYRNVHVGVGDLEAVQSYNDLMENAVMKAAASTLAHDVDLYLATFLLDFPSHVGTPGEPFRTPAQFNKMHTRLMDMAVPDDDLSSVVSFEDSELLRSTLMGGNIQGVNRTALEKASIAPMSGILPYATQHILSLTTGTRTATGALVDGAAQNVNYATVKDADYSNLVLKTAGNALTFKKGCLFTIAGVYAINARSQQVLPYLRQFVIMEDATSSAGGAVTLKIYPHIILPGSGGAEADTNTAFGTVNAAPADSAALTFFAAASTIVPTKAAWNKQAIQLVSARLRAPMSDTSSFAQDPDTGIAIRYWRGSDIATGQHIHRWDMIYGAKTVEPLLGTRGSGAAAA